MSDGWIVVPNWDKFQHYKDRDPAWIKLYKSLSSNPAWCALNPHQQGVLVNIWLEYAASNGQLSVDVIRKYLGRRFKIRTLESLSDAGFIRLRASKPLDLARARAKRQIRTPTPKRGKGGRAVGGPKVTGWREVRGSHGSTVVPDPFGTDRPPAR